MSKKLVLLAVVLCMTALPALAQQPTKPNRLEERLTMELPDHLINLDKAGGVGSLEVGFEPEEGFAPGFIDGQAGWLSILSGSTIEPAISNAAPLTGSQHLRFGFDPLITPGPEAIVAVSPALGDQSVKGRRSSMTIDVKIDGLMGADYEVVPSTPSEGFVVTRVDFNYLGNIFIADFIDNTFQFVDTGVPWKLNEYGQLRIDVDPVANSIDYFYDGDHIYSSTFGLLGGTFIERVNLFSDNYNLSEFGDFDNVQITIEPENVVVPTLGQYGLAALVLLLLTAGVIRLRQR